MDLLLGDILYEGSSQSSDDDSTNESFSVGEMVDRDFEGIHENNMPDPFKHLSSLYFSFDRKAYGLMVRDLKGEINVSLDFKTNKYGLPLFAVVLPNQLGVGIPIWFMLCTCDNGARHEVIALEITIKRIFSRMANVRPSALVIDKSQQELDALLRVVNKDPHCWEYTFNGTQRQIACHVLLCWFHTKMAWVEHLLPQVPKEMREDVYSTMCNIMHSVTEEEFEDRFQLLRQRYSSYADSGRYGVPGNSKEHRARLLAEMATIFPVLDNAHQTLATYDNEIVTEEKEEKVKTCIHELKELLLSLEQEIPNKSPKDMEIMLHQLRLSKDMLGALLSPSQINMPACGSVRQIQAHVTQTRLGHGVPKDVGAPPLEAAPKPIPHTGSLKRNINVVKVVFNLKNGLAFGVPIVVAKHCR
ncbi:hypothetical protein L7F22_041783 [Adiantum nelumboides]|nr:hypothetical protein [Adiantum nelumboides]